MFKPEGRWRPVPHPEELRAETLTLTPGAG
jgi:hypothetical protein